MKPDSQNARVLAALADGRWISVPEIHRRAGTMRLNSRVAELRTRGYDIRCRTVRGDGAARYEYRLVGEARAAETGPTSRPALEQAVTRIDPHARLADQLPSPHQAGPDQVPLPDPDQLSLLA